METTWKDVIGFEGLYIVSNTGLVKSINPCRGNHFTMPMLTLQKTNRGYLRVKLRKDGKAYMRSVHRLVAMAFLPNPNNYEVVNHKDENKENNSVDNLEWCTQQYNANYYLEYKIERRNENLRQLEKARNMVEFRHVPKKHFKAVIQKDEDGNIIAKYNNASAVTQETGFPASTIIIACENNKNNVPKKRFKNIKHRAYGYVWEYAEGELVL